MAIKVGGTDVISNARALTNIASIDATTAASISAAGVGGGGEADFVATGAIANGDVVVLKSDGTVGIVSQSTSELNPITLGSANTYDSTGNRDLFQTVVYNPDEDKVVVSYRDYTTTYPMVVVGSVSGNSITFQTPVVIQSVNSGFYLRQVYDTTNDKHVFLWGKYVSGSEQHGQAVVASLSGTTLSFGSVVDFANSNGVNLTYLDAVFDSGNSKVVAVWNNSTVTDRGSTAIVGTVSGTSISFGSPTIYNTSSQSHQWVGYDPNAGKILAGVRFQSANNPAYVGTVSGTSISFGSPTTYSQNAIATDAIYDPSSQKMIVAFADFDAANRPAVAKVATISGTTVSFGSQYVFATGDGTTKGEISMAYSPETSSVMITYRDITAATLNIVRAKVSGTAISYNTAVSTGVTSGAGQSTSIAYDSTAKKFILVQSDDNNNDNGRAFVVTETTVTTDAADYIGVAAEAISNTATGAITIDGGVNEGQTGLTIGTTYYVADDGSLTTTNNGRKIGRAISATKILVDSAMSGDEMNAYLGSLV